ncbi:MAG: M1 family metallopeptidase [Chitinophagaceae bacterium]
MKKSLLLSIFCALHAGLIPGAYAQNSYWQQEVNYKLDVTLNDADQTLQGTAAIEYINHSPDTLRFIWFHIWANAYKDNSTAFYRQLENVKSRTSKLLANQKNGYMDSLRFTVNGKIAVVELQDENIDIMKIMLNDDLLPGGHVSIETPFSVKIPGYISRMGYSDGMFMITQWYPKPAVYDRKGWHPIPYLDMGEFYSEFGNFEVTINVSSEYVVAATGTLLTTDELMQYKSVGNKNLKLFKQVGNAKEKANEYFPRFKSAFKKLQYYAKNVHDFAWFADKDLVIQYDTLLLKSGKVTDVFSFKQPSGNEEWINSIEFVKDALKKYSQWIGEYPYEVAIAVEGPSNASSGGMEYPMITMITSPGADRENLDAVITHEVGHNWFYGVLATNERDHAWMDEGINTYYQFRYEAEKYRSNSIFGNAIPLEAKQQSSQQFLHALYNAFANIPMFTPIDIPAAEFSSDEDYSLTVYIKAATWMYKLESLMGRETLDSGMQEFFSQWKFRHPYPEDLLQVLQKKSGKDLGDIFLLLSKKGSLNASSK